MGTGWRRFTESIKQGTPIGSTLSPTSNDRNKAMLDDASGFEGHVKHLIAKITAASAAHEVLLKTTTEALRSNVPRVYHEIAQAPPPSPPGSPTTPSTPGGHLVKTEALTTLVPSSESVPIAADLDVEAIAASEAAAQSSVQNEVVLPLQAWLDALARLRSQQKEVEAIRLEVDSRRRTVADLTVKEAAKQAAVLRNQDAKHTAALEEASALLHHKNDKLNACAARFNEAESSLHSELTALIQDSVYLRNYAANALRLLGESLVRLAQIVSGSIASVPVHPPATVTESSEVPAVAGTIPAPAVAGASDAGTPRSVGSAGAADPTAVAVGATDPTTVTAVSAGHLAEESSEDPKSELAGETSDAHAGISHTTTPRFFGEEEVGAKSHCEVATEGVPHPTTPVHTGEQALSHIPGVEGPVMHKHSGQRTYPGLAGKHVLDKLPVEESIAPIKHTGEQDYHNGASERVKNLSLRIPA